MEEILASSTEVAEGVDTSIALVNFIKAKSRGRFLSWSYYWDLFILVANSSIVQSSASAGYRLDLKYPILFGVASILQGNLTPKEGLEGIMSMPFQMESFDERY
jgi:glycerol-3-phosphate dehydrogenase (NAD+)